MCKYIVSGGNKIEGRVNIRGAKNSILPIMAATILNENKSIIHNVPNISDVNVMIKILESIGCKVDYNNDTLIIDSSNICSAEIEEKYVRQMRSSIIIMGAMIGRLNYTKISYPGGCAIGTRPIDLHLKALEVLGIKIEEENGYIKCFKDNLKGNIINLEFPSVGATENIILAAVKAKGITKIYNAAREPEIEDLSNFLNSMGAKINGAGSSCIEIEGVDKLGEVEYEVIPDRVAIGTYMIASAITGGSLEVDKVIRNHMEPICEKLRLSGCDINYTKNGLILNSPKKINAIDLIKTYPHPGFPTDMQAQMMALLSITKGASVITETVFENRFMHVGELGRMGANIKIDGRIAIVEGVDNLTGCQVKATDLRAGAAMILAGLVANGETEIGEIYHIDRGYTNIEDKFRKLGAEIYRTYK